MNDKFHLEINSIADFLRFVQIIRGKDDAELKKEIDAMEESLGNKAEALQDSLNESKQEV